MQYRKRTTGLQLLDELVAEGLMQFTANEAAVRLGRSRTGTANLLRRLLREGLVDRVRRGHYAIRQLGTLGPQPRQRTSCSPSLQALQAPLIESVTGARWIASTCCHIPRGRSRSPSPGPRARRRSRGGHSRRWWSPTRP